MSTSVKLIKSQTVKFELEEAKHISFFSDREIEVNFSFKKLDSVNMLKS